MMERNYEFKKRLLQVHEPDRKNNDRWTKIKGTVVDDEWEIIIPKDAGMVLDYVAHDLQDYFNTSLDVYPHFRRSADINAEIADPKCKIILVTKAQITSCMFDSDKAGAYKITVGEGIVVCGATERGAAQGSYYIEDVMNLNEGPVIPKQEKTREPYFAPRMVHSGYQEDVFPTEYLKKIAHAGMDTVLLFTKGLNKNARGQFCDINDLVRRAAGVGIDVYAYSYIQSTKHPDDPDARAYYEGTYGELFANCPGIKGILFGVYSIDCPAKDKLTTGWSYR